MMDYIEGRANLPMGNKNLINKVCIILQKLKFILSGFLFLMCFVFKVYF